jgi:hypothetical protein
MVTIIKKGQEIESIKDALKKVVPKKKNNDILKFAGTLKINIDPLEWQKNMRNEWE